MLKEINSNFLFLIPKKCGVDSPKKFRPISLCNSIYKVISKVITLQLLIILPNLISDQQNGFNPRRKILKSIITVHENIHSLSLSNSWVFVMKVDLAKAYDKVDWWRNQQYKIIIFLQFEFHILNLILIWISKCIDRGFLYIYS